MHILAAKTPKNGHFSPILAPFSRILAGNSAGEGRPLFSGGPPQGGVPGGPGRAPPRGGPGGADGGVTKNDPSFFVKKKYFFNIFFLTQLCWGTEP
jgi:hypothetical protein